MEETNATIPKTRVFMSEQINEIAAALSDFQGSLKQPKLSKKVSVTTRTGRNYEFKYADLSSCIDAAAPVLKANGLAVSQIIYNWTLITLLAHKSGQWIKSELSIVLDKGADYQALGSAITYLKRYSYCAILGIAADTDDDANAACDNMLVSIQPQSQPQQQQPQPQAQQQPKPQAQPQPQAQQQSQQYTQQQLGEELNKLACCNNREDASKLWAEWQVKYPDLVADGGMLNKAAKKRLEEFRK